MILRLGEEVAILNKVIRMRLIEKLTFEKIFEDSKIYEYLWTLLSKALSQELVCSGREIAIPVEYKRGRVERDKVRELKERKVNICKAYRASASYSYRIKWPYVMSGTS